jgi:hypothetical protein
MWESFPPHHVMHLTHIHSFSHAKIPFLREKFTCSLQLRDFARETAASSYDRGITAFSTLIGLAVYCVFCEWRCFDYNNANVFLFKKNISRNKRDLCPCSLRLG